MLPGSLLALLALQANPYLDQGRTEFRALHYAEARQQLLLAKQVPTTTADERREVFDLLARASFALGKTREAEAAYAEMLASDPMAPGPEDVAPNIRALYRSAKERLFPSDFTKLEKLPSLPDQVAVQVVDPWRRVARVQLSGPSGVRSMEERGGRYQAALTPAPGEAQVRFWVEAVDAEGCVLARLGSMSEPLRADVAPPVTSAPRQREFALTPVAELAVPSARPSRWPFWTLSGAAVAAAGGGAVCTGLAVHDSHLAGSPQTWVTDQGALDSRARTEAVAANVLFVGALTLAGGAVLARVFGR